MLEVRRFDGRISIGPCPSHDALEQLARIGFRTLIDLRDAQEKDIVEVSNKAADLGLRYIGVPVSKRGLLLDDVVLFYLAAFEPHSAPVYAFSLFGRRPLAFLLLLEATERDLPQAFIYAKALYFGLEIREDRLLREFIAATTRTPEMKVVVNTIKQLRPDWPSEALLFRNRSSFHDSTSWTSVRWTQELGDRGSFC